MDTLTPTKLTLLSERARREPGCRFTSLAHLLDAGFLTQCYCELGRDRASGVDGVTWRKYGEHLEENVTALVERMKAKRLRAKCKAMKEWLKSIRNVRKLKEWWGVLQAKLRGHYQYDGVSGNMRSLTSFCYATTRLVYKWLNRRSQRRSMNWEEFGTYVEHYPLPRPRIVHRIYTVCPA